MNVKIERAKIKDIPALLKLWKEMVDYHKKLNKKDFQMKSNAQLSMKRWFVKNIKSKNSIVLKAAINQKIIGYLMAFIDSSPPVFKNDKYVYVSDGSITKEYRNKGVMKRIMQEAVKFFRKKGLREFRLRIYSKNINALKAWSKIGFIESHKLMSMYSK